MIGIFDSIWIYYLIEDAIQIGQWEFFTFCISQDLHIKAYKNGKICTG